MVSPGVGRSERDVAPSRNQREQGKAGPAATHTSSGATARRRKKFIWADSCFKLSAEQARTARNFTTRLVPM